MRNIEVLAPAGSYESLVAAVNAGADAVYIGGTKFSARAYADNPDEDMLVKGIEYAHIFGVNVYMTVNTLLKESEMAELFEYIKTYYNAGIDAVIVQDLGVFNFIRKCFPDLPVHASTQMTITGNAGACFLKKQGAYRVVPARELSLEEIRSMDRACDIEIECFVHGALCYAYSGQCLMSSLIGGRSGNRGRCAQTCRLPYDLYDGSGKKLNKSSERNLLSCKDLCSLDILPDLAEAGIDSFKIEGRMKSPRYTAGVVSIWKKYRDMYLSKGREGYRVEKSDRELLLDLFDRGGQTDGYYKEHGGRDMIALHEKPKNRNVNEKYFDYLDKTFVEGRRTLPVFGEIKLRKGERAEFAVKTGMLGEVYGIGRGTQESICIKVYGEILAEARGRAAIYEEVYRQLQKTGNTAFCFEELNIELDEDLFVPVKVLNCLRREALDKLEDALLDRYQRNDSEIRLPDKLSQAVREETGRKSPNRKNNIKFNILCEDMVQLAASVRFARDYNIRFEEISIESELLSDKNFVKVAKEAREYAGSINLYMPHIFRSHAKKFFKKYQQLIKDIGFDGFIIRSLEEVFYIRENISKDAELIFDYNIYAYNKNTAGFYYDKFGVKRLTYPLELNLAEMRQVQDDDNEMIVYGRLPMMVSAQCLKATAKGCDHKEALLLLKDRTNSLMQVKTRCNFCYNTILNSKPLSVIGMEKDIKRLSPDILRIWFTTENEHEVNTVLKKYFDSFIKGLQVENIADFTRGHLRRGIE